jgi:hypothetical protein
MPVYLFIGLYPTFFPYINPRRNSKHFPLHSDAAIVLVTAITARPKCQAVQSCSHEG